MDTYGDTVRRLCLVRLKSREDTEDIFQTVFLKYLQHTAPFANAEHEKAWFIRVTLNSCRDLLRSWLRHGAVSLEELSAQAAPEPEDRTVLEALKTKDPERIQQAMRSHLEPHLKRLESGGKQIERGE